METVQDMKDSFNVKMFRGANEKNNFIWTETPLYKLLGFKDVSDCVRATIHKRKNGIL